MPTNASLMQRRHAAIPRGLGMGTHVFVERARNAEVWDAEGKRYIDFGAGIAVTNTGHLHPKVMEAVAAQCRNYAHLCFQVTGYEGYVTLAERLNALAPDQDAKSIFFTTGAEATENAVKIARAHTGRMGVVTFTGAFHGRTQLTMAMTGKAVPYRPRGTPPSVGIHHVPFPIPHHGTSLEDTLRALHHLFKADLQPRDCAAIVIEPVQGEGGFYQCPPALMTKLREICDEHGICLVADEVQSGFARTGRMFAIEHYDVEPDLIPVAKALGGGFPIAGVIGKAEIMDAADPGGLGGTFAGNPVSVAAALAVLDVIEGEGLCARADAIGRQMTDRLQRMKQSNSLRPMGDVRALGAMVAFELVKERGTNEPDPEATRHVTAAAAEAGLILLSCGYYANTVRLLAPLTIPDEHLAEGLDRLEAAMKA